MTQNKEHLKFAVHATCYAGLVQNVQRKMNYLENGRTIVFLQAER